MRTTFHYSGIKIYLLKVHDNTGLKHLQREAHKPQKTAQLCITFYGFTNPMFVNHLVRFLVQNSKTYQMSQPC